MVDRIKVIKKIAKHLEETNYKDARYLIGRLEIIDKAKGIGKI